MSMWLESCGRIFGTAKIVPSTLTKPEKFLNYITGRVENFPRRKLTIFHLILLSPASLLVQGFIVFKMNFHLNVNLSLDFLGYYESYCP
jgi:hypothetical protein